jgi:hypothetical protein
MTIQCIVAEGPYALTFFARFEDAERHLEANDVEDGIYRGFDREGRLLSLTASGNDVQISLAEQEPTHADELRRLVKGVLSRVGRPASSDDLSELLAQCEDYVHKPHVSCWDRLRAWWRK